MSDSPPPPPSLTGCYLLPWAVAATRSRPNVGSIALVNLFLGWSLVGWVVALVWASSYAPPPAALPPENGWGR